MPKSRIQNYIFLSIGFTVITLFISFHLIQAIRTVMDNYNWLVNKVNNEFNTNYTKSEIAFFGTNFDGLNIFDNYQVFQFLF